MRAIHLAIRPTIPRDREPFALLYAHVTSWAPGMRLICAVLWVAGCAGSPTQVTPGALAGCWAQLRRPAPKYAPPESHRQLERLRLDTTQVAESPSSLWDVPWRRLHMAEGALAGPDGLDTKWRGMWLADSLHASLSLRLGLGAGFDVDSLRVVGQNLLRGQLYETGEGAQHLLGVATWRRIPCGEVTWAALPAS